MEFRARVRRRVVSTHAARLVASDDGPGRVIPLPGHRADPVNGATMQPVNGIPAPLHFRRVLGRFATGVVAITAIDPDTGEACGLAANSFTSVSLDPPLVAFCVAYTSTTWPRVRHAPTLCVNVLAEHHEAVCAQLAAKGGDKFAGIAWSRSPGGGPIIDGSLAWLDCTVEAEHPAGDHVIVVARVDRLEAHEDHGPLVFFRGAYGRFHA